jgi:long-chain acyl-CoA synthetase
VEWILSDSAAKAVFIETAAHRDTVDSVVDRLPVVRHVWQIDGPGSDGAAGAIDLKLTLLILSLLYL